MSAIVLLVEMELNPGRRGDFIARVQTHRQRVLSEEPGCQRFDLVVPDDDEDRVFLYEVYADDAALKAHMETPYMQEYRTDTGPMVAERKRTLCTLANG